MNPNMNLPLAAGLLLNVVRLLIIHTDAEKWLEEHLKLPNGFWHFAGGLACALMLLGIIFMYPGAAEKLQTFKNHLFGR